MSPVKGKNASPGKARGIAGESHTMTLEEMKDRYIQLEQGAIISNLQDNITKTVNTHGSWSNREEEWYFTNKILLFAVKEEEVVNEWVDKLNALVTDP